MKKLELTLALFKPDVQRFRNYVKQTENIISKYNLEILHHKQLVINKNLAEKFYTNHKGKFYYDRLVNYMTCGLIGAYILRGENAISNWRLLLGPTKVYRAIHEQPGSLRGQFGLTDTRNGYHGSDTEIVDKFNTNQRSFSQNKTSTSTARNNENKIFCAIVTKPSNFNQSIAIKNSWARRCDEYIFISNEKNSFLPSININVKEGRQYLWQKTKRMFRYIYDNKLNQFDFFVKIDDDSFVIIENLREFLKQFNSEKLIYTGRRFKLENQQSYMSGGAGYVLSRAAVKLLVEFGIGRHRACVHEMEESEDVNLGKCLQGLNVEFIDSRDEFGLERFHPLSFKTTINSKIFNLTTWIPKFNYYPLNYDFKCCSAKSITFHYLSQEDISDLEFLLYHLVIK